MKLGNRLAESSYVQLTIVVIFGSLLRGYYDVTGSEEHWLPTLLLSIFPPLLYGGIFFAAIHFTASLPANHKISTISKTQHALLLIIFCFATTESFFMFSLALIGISLLEVPGFALAFAIKYPLVHSLFYFPTVLISLVVYFGGTEPAPGDDEGTDDKTV